LKNALAGHAQLQVLDLSGCGITDAGAALLAGVLAAHSGRRAELAWMHGLRSGETSPPAPPPPAAAASVQAAAAAAGHAHAHAQPPPAGGRVFGLQQLLLCSNPISDRGAGSLAAALQSDWAASCGRGGAAGRALRVLDLRCCRLTERSAAAFKQALAELPDGGAGGVTIDLRGNGGEQQAGAESRTEGKMGVAPQLQLPAGGVLWGALPGSKPPGARRRQLPKQPSAAPVNVRDAAARGSRDTGTSTKPRQKQPSPSKGAAAATLGGRRAVANRPAAAATSQSLDTLQRSFLQAEGLIDGLEARLMLLMP
jgi:hypothetical protein